MSKVSLFRRVYIWYRERYFWHLKKKSVQEIFTDIYKNNTWGGAPGTFYSGDGTHSSNAKIYIDNIADFIKKHHIRSVLDIGCGDFRIMSKILEKVEVDYTGADLVEDMLAHHREKYGNEKTRFVVLNAIKDELPQAELVTIRQVLQHLSNAQIQEILNKLSAFKYVIITEHMLTSDNVVPNLDKIPGPHIRTRVLSSVFIDKPPFNVKNPKVLFEYAEDEKVKSVLHPAVIRTYLIANAV